MVFSRQTEYIDSLRMKRYEIPERYIWSRWLYTSPIAKYNNFEAESWCAGFFADDITEYHKFQLSFWFLIDFFFKWFVSHFISK